MKTLKSVQRQRKIWNFILTTVMILSFLCLVGFVVVIFMLGAGKGDDNLMMILCGSFFAGGCALGIVGLLLFKKTDALASEELDLLEREDGPYSFFVGEGTLATFEEENLRIHGRGEGKKDIVVPYFDLKFYSVCSRRRAQERGNFSVVIQIPSRYFNNNATRDMPVVLIQTEGKERLYQRIAELKLELVGEPFVENASSKKFVREEKLGFWHPIKVKKALVLMGFGVILLLGGILAMIFWKGNRAFGSILIVLGAYCGIRGAIALFRSKAELSFYAEGVFYRDPEQINSVFLKWEEFSHAKNSQKDGKRYLTLTCPYGDYDLPYFEGALSIIKSKHPEKTDGV